MRQLLAKIQILFEACCCGEKLHEKSAKTFVQPRRPNELFQAEAGQLDCAIQPTVAVPEFQLQPLNEVACNSRVRVRRVGRNAAKALLNVEYCFRNSCLDILQLEAADLNSGKKPLRVLELLDRDR